MKLCNVLENSNYNLLCGSVDIEINSIQYDSRKVSKGDVFFCIEGFNVDGHKYVEAALNNGAVAIVCQREINVPGNYTIIKVEDSRKALALCASNFYDNPSKKLKLIGITGTNGKTTSTFMMKSILEYAGYKVGVIGTIANYIGDKKIPSNRTTPESLELHKLFCDMVSSGVNYCVMEVSSHSLSLDRVYGLEFDEGIFTNLTQDHLDFHKTFENYFEAKFKLFEHSKNSVVNIDDIYGMKVIEKVTNNKMSYAIDKNASLKAENIEMHSRGVHFDLVYNSKITEIALGLPGKYNVYNALGVCMAALNQGISLEIIKRALQNVQVPGRCEIVTRDYDLGFEVIVDYAHTPDGLENILKTAREFTKGRLISVFGCGGDRDKTKRPIMGKIGADLSDMAIITSDNPRTEEPIEIIKDVTNGINSTNYEVVENRAEAIKRAMIIAKKDDVIVVAGKGHEDYQVLKDRTIHFDEREVIAKIIKELF